MLATLPGQLVHVVTEGGLRHLFVVDDASIRTVDMVSLVAGSQDFLLNHGHEVTHLDLGEEQVVAVRVLGYDARRKKLSVQLEELPEHFQRRSHFRLESPDVEARFAQLDVAPASRVFTEVRLRDISGGGASFNLPREHPLEVDAMLIFEVDFDLGPAFRFKARVLRRLDARESLDSSTFSVIFDSPDEREQRRLIRELADEQMRRMRNAM